jgi:hypothetical protein
MSLDSARYPQIFNEFSTVSVDNNDIVLVYKESTGQLHGILGSDLFPGTSTDTTTFIWSAAVTYATDDVVVFNDVWYRSLQDSNLNNIPATGSAFWTQINRISTVTIPDWAAGLYVERATVFVGNVLYRIRSTVTLPFNSAISPESDSTNWQTVIEGQVQQFTLPVIDTETELRAITTATRSPGIAIGYKEETSRIFRFYTLRAGTDADDSPNVIRPDDYAATTNERVWELALVGATSVTTKVKLISDFDNNGDLRFTGPLTLLDPELYDGVTTVTYETALDGASPSFTAQANVAAVNSWISSNVTTDTTKWILNFFTDASKSPQVDFRYPT